MQCPFCKEEIIDGAKVCRFCRKDQPLSAGERVTRSDRRWIIGGVVFVALVIFLLTLSAHDPQYEDQRLQSAAACNGTVTTDQLRASANTLAKQSNVSEVEAMHTVETIACPSMSNQ